MAEEFLGVGPAFPLNVDGSGALALADGQEKVRQSVLLILNTALGERQMRPDFGSLIEDQVFGPIRAATLSTLSFQVQEALIEWEPRIEVQDVRVSGEKAQDGILLVSVDYKVRSTNNVFNLVYPFFVKGFLS